MPNYREMSRNYQCVNSECLFPGPRECTICGELANYECKECYTHFGDGLDQIAFCSNCLRKVSHIQTYSHIIDYVRLRRVQPYVGS